MKSHAAANGTPLGRISGLELWIKEFTSLQTKLGHALSGFERFLDRVKAGFFPPNEMWGGLLAQIEFFLSACCRIVALLCFLVNAQT
jgi:hypothetical protein